MITNSSFSGARHDELKPKQTPVGIGDKNKQKKNEESVAVTFCSSHLDARQSQWTALCRFWALIAMAMSLCHPRGKKGGGGIDAPTGACHDVISLTSSHEPVVKLSLHFPCQGPEK